MQTSVSENEDSVIEHTLVGGIADLFLYIGGKADSIADGIILAKEAIDSGKAAEVLGNLVNYTK